MSNFLECRIVNNISAGNSCIVYIIYM